MTAAMTNCQHNTFYKPFSTCSCHHFLLSFLKHQKVTHIYRSQLWNMRIFFLVSCFLFYKWNKNVEALNFYDAQQHRKNYSATTQSLRLFLMSVYIFDILHCCLLRSYKVWQNFKNVGNSVSLYDFKGRSLLETVFWRNVEVTVGNGFMVS